VLPCLQFIEDMSAAAAVAAGQSMPSGFVNVGNTCYANSMLEVLRYVPEVKTALEEKATVDVAASRPLLGSGSLSTVLGSTFKELDHSHIGVPPLLYVPPAYATHAHAPTRLPTARVMQLTHSRACHPPRHLATGS
ncbi:hypothetical protein EON62_03845, partial [archaeon]